MWLRRMSAAGLVLLVGCSASTTGPSGQPERGPAAAVSATASPAAWNGTDLLWDAIGTADGFTAVGNSGVVVSSPDGHGWQQAHRVTHQTLRGIATDGTTVAAVGTGGAVVSWPAGDPNAAKAASAGPPITLLGIANGNGTWVTGGSGGTVLTSPDLAHWTEHSTGTDGDIFAIAYGAGQFVAVTDTGSIVSSPDGATWTTARAADGLWLWGVTYGAHGFLATGANGTILQSPDGHSWTPRTSGTTQVLRGVVYGHGEYLAVGSDAAAVSSPDGITWTARDLGDVGVELWRPAATSTAWLAVGAGGTRDVSANLVSWSGGHSTRTAFYGVGSDGTTVLASGVNGTVARRGSAGSWATVATAPGQRELRSVTHLGSTWVATGGGGTILTSSDGTTFTARSSGSKAELWSSATTGGASPRLVVVGAGGAILDLRRRGPDLALRHRSPEADALLGHGRTDGLRRGRGRRRHRALSRRADVDHGRCRRRLDPARRRLRQERLRRGRCLGCDADIAERRAVAHPSRDHPAHLARSRRPRRWRMDSRRRRRHRAAISRRKQLERRPVRHRQRAVRRGGNEPQRLRGDRGRRGRREHHLDHVWRRLDACPLEGAKIVTESLFPAYARTRERVIELLAAVPGDELDRVVPACPDWTVHDLLAHVVSIPAALAAGRLPTGEIGDWLSELVAERAEQPARALADEWRGARQGAGRVAVGPVRVAVR